MYNIMATRIITDSRADTHSKQLSIFNCGVWEHGWPAGENHILCHVMIIKGIVSRYNYNAYLPTD